MACRPASSESRRLRSDSRRLMCSCRIVWPCVVRRYGILFMGKQFAKAFFAFLYRHLNFQSMNKRKGNGNFAA